MSAQPAVTIIQRKFPKVARCEKLGLGFQMLWSRRREKAAGSNVNEAASSWKWSGIMRKRCGEERYSREEQKGAEERKLQLGLEKCGQWRRRQMAVRLTRATKSNRKDWGSLCGKLENENEWEKGEAA